MDSSNISLITGENVAVSIRLVWTERKVLVGLVPHPLRPKATPTPGSAAEVADRMAMVGSGRLGSPDRRDVGEHCRRFDANRELMGALTGSLRQQLQWPPYGLKSFDLIGCLEDEALTADCHQIVG